MEEKQQFWEGLVSSRNLDRESSICLALEEGMVNLLQRGFDQEASLPAIFLNGCRHRKDYTIVFEVATSDSSLLCFGVVLAGL